MGRRKEVRSRKPSRLIVLGFFFVIVVGTILLALPVSAAEGEELSLLDSFFTATSAVCVTGLVSVDPGTSFSMFGQVVLAVLIQIGGLGVASIGAMVLLATKGRIGPGEQKIIKEGLNLSSGKGIRRIIGAVLCVTLFFEGMGALAGYVVFSQDYGSMQAAWISIFHSVAAFNNAGFDILGNFQSLTAYRENVQLNLVTCLLVIVGGLGFPVLTEAVTVRSWRRVSLHTKAVITATGILLVLGAVLFRVIEGTSWTAALFQSVTARTAGFTMEDLSTYSNGGILILLVLMFIGASPGSTGGGVKTTTVFVLLKKLESIVRNRNCSAFGRTIPEHVVMKAFSVVLLAGIVILGNVFCLCVIEQDMDLKALVFEVVSACSTTGLSLGITPQLQPLSKIILVVAMFIGRLGPLTMATVWLSGQPPVASYSEEEVAIG